MKALRKQQGVALLTVLLVLGLASFLARDMLLTGFTETQNSMALRDSRQAYYFALGGEAYARELLWQDRDRDIKEERDVDSRNDAWSSEELSFNLDEGQLQIRITDLQSRFNLGNLRSPSGAVDAVAVAQLRRLLNRLGIEQDLAYRFADWVDSDSEVGSRGAEDQAYIKSSKPMLAANTGFADIAELSTLVDLGEQQFLDLAKHLTTLPERTKLNVNTVASEVLSSLVEQVNESGVSALTSRQGIKSYENVSQALSESGLVNSNVESFLTTASDYFEIEVIAVYQDRSSRLRSVIHRQRSSGKTRVLYRSQQNSLKAS